MLMCVGCFGLIVSNCQVIGWKDPSEDAVTWWGDYLHKAQVEESVCVFLLFGFSMFLCVSPGPTRYIFHTPMTWYSLFVLKVSSLNTNKANKTIARLVTPVAPPPSSTVAPVKSRMETFWYWLTQVHLEKWPLNGERETFSCKEKMMMMMMSIGIRRHQSCQQLRRCLVVVCRKTSSQTKLDIRTSLTSWNWTFPSAAFSQWHSATDICFSTCEGFSHSQPHLMYTALTACTYWANV